jgi:hypothetical protein
MNEQTQRLVDELNRTAQPFGWEAAYEGTGGNCTAVIVRRQNGDPGTPVDGCTDLADVELMFTNGDAQAPFTLAGDFELWMGEDRHEHGPYCGVETHEIHQEVWPTASELIRRARNYVRERLTALSA